VRLSFQLETSWIAEVATSYSITVLLVSFLSGVNLENMRLYGLGPVLLLDAANSGEYGSNI
jgi:hypothetical protein